MSREKIAEIEDCVFVRLKFKAGTMAYLRKDAEIAKRKLWAQVAWIVERFYDQQNTRSV